LSPVPFFRRALKDPDIFGKTRLSAIVGNDARAIYEATGEEDLGKAIELLLTDPMQHRELMSRPLQQLGLAYLAYARQDDKPHDPVALFHLSNGARLERINVFANTSPRGLKESAGLMVNYRYIPEDFESNHEAFIHRQQVTLARKLHKELKNIKQCWEQD